MKQYKVRNPVNKDFGFLLAFKLNKNLPSHHRTTFLRKLRGYTDYSQYGRYRYQRPGLLAQKNILYYSPIRGVMVIKEKDLTKIKRLFSSKAQIFIWRVVLTKRDIKEMVRQSKGGSNEC